MGKQSQHRFGRRLTSERLRYLAAGLAYGVAVLHLFHPKHGFGRLALLASSNTELLISHPRPVAFVLSGLAIIIGIKLVLFGIADRSVYVLGIVLMATYILGYFAWHLSGHGGILPGREPLYHGLRPHEAVIAHLRGDLWAAVAIISESILLSVLAVLYRREPRKVE